MLHASAKRATARNVSCSPPPAIITGGRGFWTGFGSRIASSTWKYLPWNVVRFSVHIARTSRTASSICRMRTAGRGGNSQPYWRYSVSKFPAPIPSVSRPPADQIYSGGDPGQMCGIAVADRGGERGQANAAGHSGERRQDGPPFHKGFIGRAPTPGIWIRWSITENQTKPWFSAHCAFAFTGSNASAGLEPNTQDGL